MIYGIGVDSVLCKRMEKSMDKESFCRKVFCPEELEFLGKLTLKQRAESAAANFAAKEAFLKACGLGLGGFELNEISVLRKSSGEPYYAFFGEAADFCDESSLTAHLSLTHEGGFATAFCVLEKA